MCPHLEDPGPVGSAQPRPFPQQSQTWPAPTFPGGIPEANVPCWIPGENTCVKAWGFQFWLYRTTPQGSFKTAFQANEVMASGVCTAPVFQTTFHPLGRSR